MRLYSHFRPPQLRPHRAFGNHLVGYPWPVSDDYCYAKHVPTPTLSLTLLDELLKMSKEGACLGG